VLLLVFSYSIGVNIHMPIYSGFFPTLLHAAKLRTELPVIRLLIKEGADRNTPYSDNQTLAFHAVPEGSLDAVRALVDF